MTDEYITSYEFFKDDIQRFDDQIKLNDDLYNEIHSLFKKVNGGGGAVGRPIAPIRDVAELAKSLSSIRGTSIEANNKKISAKRIVADLSMKKILKGQNTEDTENAVKEVMRELNRQLNDGKPRDLKKGLLGADTPLNDEQLLEERIRKETESGSMKINGNERAMKYDFKGVDYAYDQESGRVVATTKNTGEVIPDYPKDRLPNCGGASKKDGNDMIMEDGSRIAILKDE